MARFFIDDSSGTDQRSLLNTSKFASLMGRSTPVSASKVKFISTNAQSGDFSLVIAKDTIFRVGPHMCYTEADVSLSKTNLHQQSGSDFVNGHDYAIFAYLSPDAIANNLDESYVIVDCANETPKGYSEDTCLCIGGFHYGYCATYDTSYNLTGAAPHLGVLEFSIWTTLHRASLYEASDWKANRGLTYIPPINKWVGIYKGLDSTGKYCAYGIAPTVLSPNVGERPYHTLINIFHGDRKWRPMQYAEYLYAAYGCPDIVSDDNTNAWISSGNSAATTNGAVVNSVSLYGCKDMIGNAYEAFFDPSGDRWKVLTSRTSYNSGGLHTAMDITDQVRKEFSFRICVDNVY